MVVTIIILILIIAILGYATSNLLKKVEKLEDKNDEYFDLVTQVREMISYSAIKLKEIDNKGTFESDDEVGWFFKQIKTLQEMFNKFIPKSNEQQPNS